MAIGLFWSGPGILSTVILLDSPTSERGLLMGWLAVPSPETHLSESLPQPVAWVGRLYPQPGQSTFIILTPHSSFYRGILLARVPLAFLFIGFFFFLPKGGCSPPTRTWKPAIPKTVLKIRVHRPVSARPSTAGLVAWVPPLPKTGLGQVRVVTTFSRGQSSKTPDVLNNPCFSYLRDAAFRVLADSRRTPRAHIPQERCFSKNQIDHRRGHPAQLRPHPLEPQG